MKLKIDKRFDIPTIDGNPDISAKEFNEILGKMTTGSLFDFLSPLDVPVLLMITIRTTTTNRVLSVKHLESSVSLGYRDYITTSLDLTGYFLLVANIQRVLREKLGYKDDRFVDAMRTSVLQPMGFIKTEDRVYICFTLIVSDKYEEMINECALDAKFEDIKQFSSFTNMDEVSKIILPTLKIVG